MSEMLGKLRKLFVNSRPQMPAYRLVLLTALFILVANNQTFWHHAVTIFEGRPLNLAIFGGIGFSVILFSIALLAFPYLQRIALAILVILASVSAYYQDYLGIVIDVDMLQNVINTTSNEAKHLITLPFVMRVVFYGLLPALVILWVKITPSKWWKQILVYFATWILAFALFLALVFSDFKTNSAVIREHRELNYAIQPSAPLSGGFNYIKRMFRSTNLVVAPLGTDVKAGPRLASAQKPVFMVLVVGETARAQNYAFNGYARDTNPAMRARDVIFYHDVASCGTSTAVSMPCMFSRLPRADYSFEKARSEENLLDILTHAGWSVEWLDNNTGDLGVAMRAKAQILRGGTDVAACVKGECTDDILTAALQDRLATATGNTVLVLHQIGSHGPSYYLRYPDGFAPFGPACQSSNFGDCSKEEIVNAYDNSIAYSDKVLGDMIDALKGQDKFLTSLIYMSDHGESLGENGIFLHAAPYFMAPIEQIRVPAAIWMSDSFAAQMEIDPACMRKSVNLPISHDNFFSTVLGMLNLQTSATDPALDLTNPCRNP